MIRYLKHEHVYYSLNDVTAWLHQQAILTHEQSQVFAFQCRAYIAKRLSTAYEEQCLFDHLEPIIFPNQDYFVHWILWANLLMLLPESVGCHRKVHQLNLLLDNPETVYMKYILKPSIKLVCISTQQWMINN